MNDWMEKIAEADEMLTEAVWEKVAEEAGTTPEEAVANVAQAVADNPELAPAVEEAVEEEKESMMEGFSRVMDKIAEAKEKAVKETAEKGPSIFSRAWKATREAPGKAWGFAAKHPYGTAGGLAGLAALGGGTAYGVHKYRQKKSAAEYLAEALYL